MSCNDMLEFVDAAPGVGPDLDTCQMLRRIHNNALLKIAQVQIDDADYYEIGGRRNSKPSMLRALQNLVEWSAQMYYSSCSDASIASAKPNLDNLDYADPIGYKSRFDIP